MSWRRGSNQWKFPWAGPRRNSGRSSIVCLMLCLRERRSFSNDMTQAFRSLPFVIFGVINYLRHTRGIYLQRIVYGAYEAKESGPDGVVPAPIFDLAMLLGPIQVAIGGGGLRCS